MDTYFLSITYTGDNGEARWAQVMTAAVNEMEATLIVHAQFRNARVKNIRGLMDVIGIEKDDFFRPEGETEPIIETYIETV